uniref:CACN subunit beta associated regulatory protein n=1 Tax=Chelonoidis abingdonii TaxID=106734 RepID=A0A8C0G7H4_CHEAB
MQPLGRCLPEPKGKPLCRAPLHRRWECASPVLSLLCPQTVPSEVNTQDGYVLLLVLLSIFIGGTLVLLSGILIICRQCCETDRRASDDPEKTNTTYLDDSQPPQGKRPPACHYRDVETERFLSSSSSTGRRVSFNEAALFEQSKKTQEKGRRYGPGEGLGEGRGVHARGRYTLTEGDFHHLKNARLTHLHVPPPALRIITIHECESSENSLAMSPRLPLPKPGLAIFQVNQGCALTAHAMCPSSALPGDTYNSTVDTSFAEASPSISSSSGESPLVRATRSAKGTGAGSAGPGEPPPPPPQGTVLQFFTRLRRHASLEGTSPYFKIKKWKIESNQRASSLDTRGSPKRRQFQRQRAASESMEQEDRDAHQTGIIQYIARTDDIAFRPMAGPFLPSPSSPPPSLGRLEPAEAGGGSVPEAPSTEQQTIYHDIWSLRASLELYASSEQSNDRDSVRSDGGDSVCSAGGGIPSFPSSLEEPEGLDEQPWARPRQESAEAEPGTRKLLQMDSGYASIEAPSRAGEDGEGAVGGPLPHSPLAWSPYGQMFPARDTLPRRDYSIDEKTDALFNAFVRHDPQFDDSPLRAKHRSRTHLRKQWQRSKQYSDPGVRYPPALERHRTPLRRGDSLNYPPDSRYHGTLPRIISTEEAGEAGDGSAMADADAKIQVIEEEPSELGPGCIPQPLGAELMDKIMAGLEDRLYGNLRKSRESPECLVAVASPDHSPV